MITISVYPLAVGQPPMFQREFTRQVDADDYEAFWRKLGSCHLKRAVK